MKVKTKLHPEVIKFFKQTGYISTFANYTYLKASNEVYRQSFDDDKNGITEFTIVDHLPQIIRDKLTYKRFITIEALVDWSNSSEGTDYIINICKDGYDWIIFYVIEQ